MVVNKEDKLREEILNSAQKLFQQYGLRKTTMEDIAKKSGKGKSTLYYYYASKEEIFDEVVRREADEVFTETQKAIAAASTAEDKLRAYFVTSLKMVQTKVNLYNLVRNEFVDDNAARIRNMIKKINLNDIETVKEILQLGIQNHEFTTDIMQGIDLIAYIIVSATRSILIDLALDAPVPDWELRSHVMIDLFIKGCKSNAILP
ncbi:MAG: TetR/AcrR family transcriptional regulator [Microbacter sp.]